MAGDQHPRSYLIECYWPGVSEQQHAETAKRARSAAFERRRGGGNVHFLGSILIPLDETIFCLFAGHEIDVRAVAERAGVSFERVLESLIDHGGDPRRDLDGDPRGERLHPELHGSPHALSEAAPAHQEPPGEKEKP